MKKKTPKVNYFFPFDRISHPKDILYNSPVRELEENPAWLRK
jgi:hypothetical protein